MDTEGFEASGKADAYDDRIFALSTVVASLLVMRLASRSQCDKNYAVHRQPANEAAWSAGLHLLFFQSEKSVQRTRLNDSFHLLHCFFHGQ